MTSSHSIQVLLRSTYMPKISPKYEAMELSGMVNFDVLISFTDPIVTKVCDICLGIMGSPSVTDRWMKAIE